MKKRNKLLCIHTLFVFAFAFAFLLPIPFFFLWFWFWFWVSFAMSSRPLNFKHQPGGGYNHHSMLSQAGAAWKGAGTPVGSVPGNLRPLTNRDPGNVFPTGFGLPRPLKQYRRGRSFPVTSDTQAPEWVVRNEQRYVRSSQGTYALDAMQTVPGGFAVTTSSSAKDNVDKGGLLRGTVGSLGVPVTTDVYPNQSYWTDNPNENTTTPALCCNPERKALRRVVYANTNMSPTYYTTHAQYMQARCRTYDQRSFQYLRGTKDPGYYVANCQSCVSSSVQPCALVVYKPNNKQFAQQGAVSSSTRLLALQVQTLTKRQTVR